MPQPDTDDEVAELARTLDEMLRELDAARGEIEQMVIAQREFVADASHELRTPLTSILANLELLQERLAAGGGDTDDAEMVSSALRSSRRMRRLVGDLLLLARADAGRVSRRRECDLGEIVEAAVAEVRPVANDHPLEFEADETVPLMGNADELHRLAVNLIDNGVRHTPAGTTIGISVTRRNGTAILEVADDGPGLPAGQAENLLRASFAATAPPTSAAATEPGSGWRSSRPWPSHGGSVAAGRSTHGAPLRRHPAARRRLRKVFSSLKR